MSRATFASHPTPVIKACWIGYQMHENMCHRTLAGWGGGGVGDKKKWKINHTKQVVEAECNWTHPEVVWPICIYIYNLPNQNIHRSIGLVTLQYSKEKLG